MHVTIRLGTRPILSGQIVRAGSKVFVRDETGGEAILVNLAYPGGCIMDSRAIAQAARGDDLIVTAGHSRWMRTRLKTVRGIQTIIAEDDVEEFDLEHDSIIDLMDPRQQKMVRNQPLELV